MERARIIVDGKPRNVTLLEFIAIRAENPEACKNPTCIECGHRVHTHNEKGALGFNLVNREVMQRKTANKRSMPGFHHHDHDAGLDCSLSFANDPRFKGLREHNEFDALEKEINLQALAVPRNGDTPGAREAIFKVQSFFLHILTGSTEVSPDHRKQLVKVEKKLSNMVGLAKNLWVLGYLGPILLGPAEKQMGNRKVRIEFRGVGGFQNLPFTGLDGQERTLRVPKQIALCWSRKDGKEPKPFLNGGYRLSNRYVGGKPVVFEVSRAFAKSIVMPGQKRSSNDNNPSSSPVAPAQAVVPRRPLSRRTRIRMQQEAAGQTSLNLGGGKQ